MENSPLIPFVAIGRHDKSEGFIFVTSFCVDEDNQDVFEKYAKYKLKSVELMNYMSIIESQLGVWYVKGYAGWTCMITTSPVFPNDVAVECLDEFYEIFHKVQRLWGAKKRANAQEICCKGIAKKYGTLEVGSAPHMIMTEIDEDVRRQYSNSIQNLMDQVDKLKDEMSENMVEALKKGENLDRLLVMSSDLLEQANVFRKRAKKVKWTMWAKANKGVLIGTTCFTAAGAVVGFMAGGPTCAVLLTDPFVGAQAIEASMSAIIFGAGFLGARSAMKTWFWNQQFVVL